MTILTHETFPTQTLQTLADVAIQPTDVLAPWLARVVATGAGDGGTLERLAATLTYAETLMLCEIQPPWQWATPPVEIYENFAQKAGYALVSARAAWKEIAAFSLEKPYPYARLLALRPIAEIQAAVERQRSGVSDTPDLAADLRALLDRGQPASAERIELLAIARRHGIGASEARQAYRDLEREAVAIAGLAGDRAALDEIEAIRGYDPDAATFLGDRLGAPIDAYAARVGVSAMAIVATLLSGVAAVAPASALLLRADTGLHARPVVWTAIVAESGVGKSPAQRPVTEALCTLQAEAWEKFQEAAAVHRAATQGKKGDAPELPTLRHYITTDTTIEAIARIQAGQASQGFLIHHDELSGFFSSQNAYRGGRGADRERLLSGCDGAAIKVDRASSGPIFVGASRYAVTGTTQIDTLGKVVAQSGGWDDSAGQFARFDPVVMRARPRPWSTEPAPPGGSLTGLIELILRAIENQKPQNFCLSHEAKIAYGAWWNACDWERLNHAQSAFRAIYSKAQQQTGDLALLLHLIDAAIAGRDPAPEVSTETVERAIALKSFFIDQWKLIHATIGGEDRGESAARMDVLWAFAQARGSISASDVRQRCQGRGWGLSPAAIRDLMLRLVATGRGRIEGDGCHVRLVADVSATAPPPPSPPPPRPPEPAPDRPATVAIAPLPPRRIAAVADAPAVPAAETPSEPALQISPLWGYRAGEKVQIFHKNRWIEGVVRYAEPHDGRPVVRLKTGAFVTVATKNALRRAG
ncbi:MAG: hypothetical protein OHK0037_27650 [Elainellaceae cyanobacterium]